MGDRLTHMYEQHGDLTVFLKEKTYALHMETLRRSLDHKDDFDAIIEKIKEMPGFEKFLEQQQQLGKFIFASSIITQMDKEGGPAFVDKMWKVRGWRDNGDRIEKDPIDQEVIKKLVDEYTQNGW